MDSRESGQISNHGDNMKSCITKEKNYIDPNLCSSVPATIDLLKKGINVRNTLQSAFVVNGLSSSSVVEKEGRRPVSWPCQN